MPTAIPTGTEAAAAATGVRFEPVVGELPEGFDDLRAAARAEGYRHLERLAADWTAHTARFDRRGELLLAARSGGKLVAVGGLTADPYMPDALRMRRFYVRPSCRRTGIGRGLARSLLDRPVVGGRLVTVNAAAGSAAFWMSLGFLAEARDGHTHVLAQPDRRNRDV